MNMSKTPLRQVNLLLMVGTGIIVFVFGVWLWWTQIYTDPERAFWRMLDNNLRTYGASKTVSQAGNDGSLEQKSYVIFGDQPMVSGRTIIVQSREGGAKSRVVTESIGTKDTNFLKYSEIKTGAAPEPNFSPITNVWSSKKVEGSGESLLGEAVFGTFPFALLTSSDRQEIMKFIREQNVYKPQYEKTESGAGGTVYVYSVEINTPKYVQLLKKIDQKLGLGQLSGLNPDDYANSPSVNVQVSMTQLAQLRKVVYKDNNREETFDTSGAHVSTDVPGNSISQDELQSRLQAVLTPAQ